MQMQQQMEAHQSASMQGQMMHGGEMHQQCMMYEMPQQHEQANAFVMPQQIAHQNHFQQLQQVAEMPRPGTSASQPPPGFQMHDQMRQLSNQQMHQRTDAFQEAFVPPRMNFGYNSSGPGQVYASPMGLPPHVAEGS